MRTSLFFVFVLAGCVNDGPGDPNYDIGKSMQMIRQNAMIGNHDRCLSFGAEEGTAVYTQCVNTLAEADRQAEEVRENEERRTGDQR